MSEQIRIDEALAKATDLLGRFSESPRLDAELMLTQALDVPRSYLFTYPEDTLDADASERFFSAVRRREEGEPLAYIHGEKEFWSLSLMVSPDTLVPRPETETLVQEALSAIPRIEQCDVLDLGTGSGAVALAIASERTEAQVIATDISEAALAIAIENARQLDLGNVTFLRGDWTEPVSDRAFDVIVSNPPYVQSTDPALQNLQHEPLSALAAGEDGLAAIRVLAIQCRSIIKPGGSVFLEHGADQQDAVAEILMRSGWTGVRCVTDLAGLPRVTAAIDESRSEGP